MSVTTPYRSQHLTLVTANSDVSSATLLYYTASQELCRLKLDFQYQSRHRHVDIAYVVVQNLDQQPNLIVVPFYLPKSKFLRHGRQQN